MTALTLTRLGTSPVGARSARTPVRLTRRGRVVVLLTLVTLLLGAFLLGRGADSAAAGTSSPAPQGTVTTVRPGETLWTIAKRLDPGHDPRALVQRLRSLNGLSTGAVQAGQQLRVPALG